MTAEEDKDLTEFNKKLEPFSDKIGFAVLSNLVSGASILQRNLCFYNWSNASIALYWINYAGLPVYYATIRAKKHFYVHSYNSHPWIGHFEDTGDLCKFRIGTGPEFVKDGHRVYVGCRPLPDDDDDDDGIDVYEVITLHRPKSHSLLEMATQRVAELIDYDHETALALPLPKTVQDDVIGRIDRRNKKIVPL